MLTFLKEFFFSCFLLVLARWLHLQLIFPKGLCMFTKGLVQFFSGGYI